MPASDASPGLLAAMKGKRVSWTVIVAVVVVDLIAFGLAIGGERNRSTVNCLSFGLDVFLPCLSDERVAWLKTAWCRLRYNLRR